MSVSRLIIVSLNLHNFMSYGDATLDLSSVPVACLAGQNGAGKSALLDAITWALWESARSGSDELIRLGEKEMWVDLQFIHEGQLYRVRRSRQKSAGRSGSRGTSKGTLEFQIFQSQTHDGGANGNGHGDGGNGYSDPGTAHGAWKTLTSATMRDTQKHICELLRMDFDTFINSAYLRQGKVDEFTTRPPSERKQVLGEILGLSYFDKLQERAREHVRHLKALKELLDSSLSVLPELKTRLEAMSLERQLALESFNAVLAELEELEKKAEESSARLSELSLSSQKLERVQEKIADFQSTVVELIKQKEALFSRLKELNALVSQTPAIEEQARQFDLLKNELEVLDRKALRMQDLNGRKLELQSELARMRSRLELKCESVESRLNEVKKRHEKLLGETRESEKIESAYVQYKELITREAELAQRQESFTLLSGRAQDLSAQISEARIRLEAQVSQKETAVKELQSILASKDALKEQDRSLKDETTALDALESEFELVEQKGLELKAMLESIEAQIQVLTGKQKENLEKINELEEHEHSSLCPLCCAPIVDRAAVIKRYLRLNEEAQREISRLKDKKADLEDDRNELRKKYLELKKKLEGRKDLDKRIGQLNERQLAVKKAEESLNKATDELESLKKRLAKDDYAQVERESLVAVKAEMHKLDFDAVAYSSLKGQLRAQRHIEARWQQLKKDMAELKEKEDELPKLEEELASLESELKGETYGLEIRSELRRLHEEAEQIAYDRQHHGDLKQHLSELLPALDKVRELRRALDERPQVQLSYDECARSIEAKSAQLLELKKESEALSQAVTALPEAMKTREEMEPELRRLRSDKQELDKRLAVLNAQHQSLSIELQHMSSKQGELKQTESDIEDYQLLAEAFGKKGIQAVIIENAVPEIESDANRILARLTDNKMHIALVTQHKTKAGSVVETLDLVIGDELGTRNYELYSGGEAFKVNFSIRVALSRLLARRSGAKLETLIIDEGFGSQDEISRERLVRAIRSIQSDFARIMVITHIADIKDMFPVQIQVTKQNGTSQLQLLT
ncbi:MAG TPA: SMC family ATPase [Candidatus Obscuribacterales bacterium]